MVAMSPAKLRRLPKKVMIVALIAVLWLWCIVPILWTFLTSFKPEIIAMESTRLIFEPTLSNYQAVLDKTPFVEYLKNTVIVSIMTMTLSVAFGSMAAYSFTRFKYVGSESLPLYYLVMRMLPRIVLLLPFYVMLRMMGLLNTHVGLFIAFTSFSLPFVIWLMIGFFKEIPIDLEEAAMVDGCSRVGVLWHIVVPLVMPGLVATGVFTFLMGWNEFLFALILSGRDTRTLPIIVAGFQTDKGQNWGWMTAGSVLILLPIIIFTMAAQRYIIAGATYGAVKG